MARALLTWLALFALYILFTGEASRAELCAGALVAVMGAGLAVYVRGAGHRPMRLDAPWGRLVGRVGLALARDTVKVGGALARGIGGAAVKGMIQRQLFDTRDDTRAAVGRRAVVMLATSVAPNRFVLEEEGDSLLLHRLVPAPASEDTEWPV